MNKVILMGRLTRDPESRYTQSNSSQESMVSEAERKMDVNEYHLRHIIDTDDGEPLEEGAADDH